MTTAPDKVHQFGDMFVTSIEHPGTTIVNVFGNTEAEVETTARQVRALPKLLTALRQLVTADNTGYLRETMRYCGMFDAGREAIKDATGEDLTPGHRLHTTVTVYLDLDIRTAAQALLEKLDHMTTEQFGRGEERAEREALRKLLGCHPEG